MSLANLKGKTEVMLPRKKLAIFMPSLRGGGAEKVMTVIANELVARGHTVDFVLVDAVGEFLSELNPSVNVVNLAQKRQLFCFLAMFRYLKSARPDIVLSALVSTNLIACLFKIIFKGRFRLVLSERAVSSLALRDNKDWPSMLMLQLIRYLYPTANLIIAVSKDVKDDLVSNFHIPESEIRVIYNPVSVDVINKLSLEKFEHEVFDDPDVPVVISAGRLTRQKNFKLLIQAFALARSHRKINLVVLGEGPLLSELKSQVMSLGLDDCVYFPGFVRNPFVWMKRASVFILSSNYEGLPGVLIQALACGCPVVSTDCPGGAHEILAGGKWGCLVPTNNPVILSQAMLESLNESKTTKSVNRAKFFDIKIAIDKYQKALFL